MKYRLSLGLFAVGLCLMSSGLVWGLDKPIVAPDVVFEEVDGLVAVEAEFFTRQSQTEKRRWYRTSAAESPQVGMDPDPPHVAHASNNAYLEILPDTRRTHGDKLTHGVNFAGQAGSMAVLHYQVYFNTPGRYYVWVRAHSTGSEDNGLHVGIDGTWPETGQRLQWCEGKRTWRWDSKQRTETTHCGEPYKIYLDVEAGPHEITFSMREDGFEFDKFIMTRDREFPRPVDAGPVVRVKQGRVPPPYPVVQADAQPQLAVQVAPVVILSTPSALTGVQTMAAPAFPTDDSHFYLHQDKWLAINPEQHKQAETRMPFPHPDGRYDVVFFAVGENDGQSEYRVTCNDQAIGTFVCPLSSAMFAEGKPFNTVWENVAIARGDSIAVQAKVGTDGQAFSRGRWAGMAFVSPGQGRSLLDSKFEAPSAAAPPVQHPHAQIVGLRFQNIDLPQGAAIEKAYIQLTVDENKNAGPFKVTITGEAQDSADTFGLDNHNISARSRTRASVNWQDPGNWTQEGQAGPDQQTPDLRRIVQEILKRDGWASGHAMAFVFEGSGIRTAISFEKSRRVKKPEQAPKLVVVLGSGQTRAFPVTQASDDMEEVAATGKIDDGSTDLEFCWEEIGSMQMSQVQPKPATASPVLDLKSFFSNPRIRLPDGKGDVSITGQRRQWHKVTLTLDGPYAHELDKQPNPFTDYRMTVVFKHASGAPVLQVPGYFAADGDAAETGADCGTAWRAHLSPSKTGTWHYEVQFVQGDSVANSDNAGQPIPAYHGKTGSFKVRKTNKQEPDMRARGLLQYVGERYLRFAGSGKVFLKCGADAPENLLAYADFDGPFKVDGHKDNFIKTWEPHVSDWRTGDPTWQGGKGKGLIGAINYLASEGMNAFSFLLMNIEGDDRNVFPYTHYDERWAMDVSRLDQWEIIMAHGTQMGMFLHFKIMETENELLLDKGDLGPQRKLFYRELIARFAHHPAMNWNVGEEINNASTEQKKAWAQYFWDTDPYQHHLVIHNGGDPHYDVMGPEFAYTGFSLQTNKPDFNRVHNATLNYINRSAAAGKVWAVACDEPGDASLSLVPDKDDPGHRDARVNGLWGHFTAGGWGLEWYFGYKRDHSDLTCEDWRSRDLFWDQCRHALNFFETTGLPVWDMANADDLVAGDAYCLAGTGGPYLVVLKTGGTVALDLSHASGKLKTRWFNPRTGEFTEGKAVQGGGSVTLGPAPQEPEQDWVVLID